MAEFAYKALDGQGKESAGTLTAGNRLAAMEQVRKSGLALVTLREQEPPQAPAQLMTICA